MLSVIMEQDMMVSGGGVVFDAKLSGNTKAEPFVSLRDGGLFLWLRYPWASLVDGYLIVREEFFL